MPWSPETPFVTLNHSVAFNGFHCTSSSRSRELQRLGLGQNTVRTNLSVSDMHLESRLGLGLKCLVHYLLLARSALPLQKFWLCGPIH